MKLSQLYLGQRAKVIEVNAGAAPDSITRRLMELGFIEGAEIEVVREAPFFRDPIAVKVRGAVIALRRSEAQAVSIRLLDSFDTGDTGEPSQ